MAELFTGTSHGDKLMGEALQRLHPGMEWFLEGQIQVHRPHRSGQGHPMGPPGQGLKGSASHLG